MHTTGTKVIKNQNSPKHNYTKIQSYDDVYYSMLVYMLETAGESSEAIAECPIWVSCTLTSPLHRRLHTLHIVHQGKGLHYLL